MPETRWSDANFLDSLRQQGDELADRTVAELIADNGVESVNQLFKVMHSNVEAIPPDTPPPVARFFEASAGLPEWVDRERLRRGEGVYFEHAFPMALTLLAKSLPEGYSAPNLSKILHMSEDLETHPYKRLMGVLQMVVNVGSRGGFDAGGQAIVTAQKLRLLHAGVRHVADRVLPDYREAYGVPVNHEDMLATIMGFSYLVIEGLERLGTGLTKDPAEDLYYPWRIFALIMGIHPPGQPDDGSLVPEDLAQAKEFYDSYSARHFVGPEANPEGVVLARDNLRMMQDLMPKLLRALGLGVIPRIYMNDLMTREGCARVGIRPVAGHSILKWLLHRVPRWVQRVADDTPGGAAEALSRMLFQGMIVKAWDGEVSFLVPDSVAALKRLA